MKRNFLFVMMAIMLVGVLDSCKSTQINREAVAIERRKNAVMDSLEAVYAHEALMNLDFVINADRVTLSRGETFNTDDRSTNFVTVHDGKVMLQLASMRGMSGFNGLGGITVEGNMTGEKFKTDKRGTVTLTFNTNGPAFSSNIVVTLPKDGVNATVYVQPSFRKAFTIYGKLSKYNSSKVFEGRKI